MSSDDTKRLPWVRWVFRDFFTDRVVAGMTPEEQIAHQRLMWVSWESENPGHLPNDPVYLAVMSGLGDSWPVHADKILAAWVVELNGGGILQKRLCEEVAYASHRLRIRSASGRVAAKARWDREKHAIRMRTQCDSMQEGEGRGERKIESTTPLPPLVRKPSAPDRVGGIDEEPEPTLTLLGEPENPNAEETPRQWQEGFKPLWNRYPRKAGKEAGLAAYLKVRPRTQGTYDAIHAGLDWYLKGEWGGREKEKIPHFSTWINQRRWKDAEAAED